MGRYSGDTFCEAGVSRILFLLPAGLFVFYSSRLYDACLLTHGKSCVETHHPKVLICFLPTSALCD